MKTALIFGSTGLIGGILLKLLADDQKYKKIKVFVRSSTSKIDPKIEVVQTDFTKLENIKSEIKGDDCFFCIGTTKQNSPDKNDYQKVELDIPKEIAQIAKANSVKSFIFISSIFANPNSSGNYVKFKGLVRAIQI